MSIRAAAFALTTLPLLMFGCSKQPPAFDTEHFGRTRQWLESQASSVLRECEGNNALLLKKELETLNTALASVKDRKVEWRATMGSVSAETVVFSLDDGAENINIQFGPSYITGMPNAASLGAHGEFHGGWSPSLSMPTSSVPEWVKQLRNGDAVTFVATIRGISAKVSSDPGPPRPSFEVVIEAPSLNPAHH